MTGALQRRFIRTAMVAVTALLVVLVQVMQSVGTRLAVRCDKRLR